MDSGDKLAPVTYLFGKTAEGTAPASSPESGVAASAQAEPSQAESSQPLPTFAGFFGADDDAADSSADDRIAADRDEPAAPKSGQNKREVRAENVSMHALTRRGMSRWELEKTLTSRELEPEVVEAELDRLEGVGLLDDAALAETLVRTQHERKGLGRGAIVADLRRRHIDQEHIDAALEQLDGGDELSRARELAIRRAPQMRSLDHETAKRRLSGYLMRKGYNGSIVRTAVDEALAPSGGGVRFR